MPEIGELRSVCEQNYATKGEGKDDIVLRENETFCIGTDLFL